MLQSVKLILKTQTPAELSPVNMFNKLIGLGSGFFFLDETAVVPDTTNVLQGAEKMGTDNVGDVARGKLKMGEESEEE